MSCKPYTTEELLASRRKLIETIAEIDAELEERGILAMGRRPRGRPVKEQILDLLSKGPARAADVKRHTGQNRSAVAQMLYVMHSAGEIVRTAHGVYELPPAGKGRVRT